MTLSKTLFVVAALLAAPVSTAFAQEEGGEGGEGGGEAAPAEGTPEAAPPADGGGDAPAGGPSLLVPKGKIQIMGQTININLSADAVAKPVFFTPSVYYGVNEKLSVGLTHDRGTTIWTPRPGLRLTTVNIGGVPFVAAAGAGICITGEDNGCPKVYDNIGFDALYSVASGKFSFVAHGGLDIASFDPLLLQLRVGGLGRYTATDKISIVFDPRVTIGLTERDFNKEQIDVPVWAWFTANEKVAAYLHLGIAGPLDGFGDAFAVPLGVGANYSLNEKLIVGGDFQFVNLLGKGSSADGRVLGLRLAYQI